MKKDLVTRLDALGMSRKDLAQSLGVSLSSIYHWRDIPKYADAYLRQREWLAWRDEVAEAARTRTDVPLADRMTPHVTAFGNVTWSVADEPESGSDGLDVSSVSDGVVAGSETVQLSDQCAKPGATGPEVQVHGTGAERDQNRGGVKPESVGRRRG